MISEIMLDGVSFSAESDRSRPQRFAPDQAAVERLSENAVTILWFESSQPDRNTIFIRHS